MRRTLTFAGAVLAAAVFALPAAAGQDGIPPSGAVKRAVAAVPGAEPLGVKRKGAIYVVKLKQGGSIIRMGVDAKTGDVFPMQ